MATKRTRKSGGKTTKTGKRTVESTNLFSTNNILAGLLVLSVITCVYLYTEAYGIDDSSLPVVGGVVGVGDNSQEPSQEASQYGTVELDFYIMSQCPYGTQVEDAINPVLKQLGNSVKFTLDFIASENPDGSFNSLHGQPEVDGDMIQLCAREHYPDEYMDLIICQNKNARNIPDNWRSCAVELGLDTSVLNECFNGEEGKQLMSDSIKASDAASARGSPTIYLNGRLYNGARDSLSFTRALCAELEGHPACADIPVCGSDRDCTAQPTKDGRCVNPGESDARCEYSEPVAIDLIVVNVEECATCDSSRIISVTKQLFLGVKVSEVEYNSDEGQGLAEKYEISMLPAYLFDVNILESPNYGQVANALIKIEDRYKIHPQAAGSNYNPNLVEIPNKLDLFVMSQCPYGTIAEKNVKPVLDLLGDQINFTLWFIANENPDGSFRSLHGQPEVDEDIRQLCAVKYYPDEYFDYVLCIAEDYGNAGSIWESCAVEAGLDVDTIESCFDGEGKALLSENIKVGNELAVGSSPTFMINGKQQFGGNPPEGIKQNLCTANPGLEGCDVKLEGSSSSPAATGGSC